MTEEAPQKQVLINVRTGNHVIFDVRGHEEFNQLAIDLMSKLDWMKVGKNAFIRKDEITSIYYLPEGFKG